MQRSSAQGAADDGAGRGAPLADGAAGGDDMDAEAAPDTRGGDAARGGWLGLARLDAQLGVGTALAQPATGGKRGPVIPPAYWLQQQRESWSGPGPPPPDSNFERVFRALPPAARKAIAAATPAGAKRAHGNTGASQLQRAAQKQRLGAAPGERVDSLFGAAGLPDGGGGRDGRYSLRPSAARLVPPGGEAGAEAEAEAGGAAARRPRSAFIGTRVAVPFELGDAVVFMQGEVISAVGSSYRVLYIDGDELSLTKAALVEGADAYKEYCSRTDGTFIGSRAGVERAYAAAGGQAPAFVAAPPLLHAAAGAGQGGGRGSRTGGARAHSTQVTKRQLDTADALRRMAARGGQPFVPAAPPRGAAPRRAVRCAR